MGQISGFGELLALATDGASIQNIHWYHDGRVGAAAATAPVAGRMVSLWQYNSSRGFGAVASATGEAPTNATDGGLLHTNPGAGKQLWMLGIVSAVGAGALGTLIAYDRLAQESGSSATVTTLQAVTGCVATRYTGAESSGNEIWIEITGLIGTTATTITVDYVNQAGVARTSPAVAFGGTGLREAQRIIQVPLAQGDTGVREITGSDLLATTGTAGNYTLMIVRRVAILPLPAVGVAVMRDFVSGIPGLVEVRTNACLALAWVANNTVVPIVNTHFVMVSK